MTLINKLLKRLEGWGIPLHSQSFQAAVIKLTVQYTLVVSAVLLSFSFIVYFLFRTVINKEDICKPSPFLSEDSPSFEIIEHLSSILFYTDIFCLVVTLFLAYWLAKRTMAPLEKNYLQQKKFVADTAHELRTPLAVIKTGHEVLLHKDRSITEYKSGLKNSLEEINRLISLTNSLLMLVKPQNPQKTKIETFSLTDAVSKQVVLTSEYARVKNIKLVTEWAGQVQIPGQINDISQVIINLLKNAIDYSNPGGVVLVSVSHNANWAVLKVKDAGVGIGEEDKKFIFDRFFKVDKSRANNQSGSGLGLAIVKEIVTSYGGEVSVSSVLGQGSVFKVCLPLR